MPKTNKTSIVSPAENTTNWYNNESYITELMTEAQHLHNTYEKSRIFALGQSIAWAVKAAELLASADNNKRNQSFGYIAFSGSFISANGYAPTLCFPCLNPGDEERLDSIRNYLSTIDMSPSNIIEHGCQGYKTVIVGFDETGATLASFLWILLRWAEQGGVRHQVTSNLIVQAYLCNTILDSLCIVKGDTLTSDTFIPLERRTINLTDTNCAYQDGLWQQLINASNNSDSPERLLPEYHYQDWSHPPIMVETEEQSAIITRLQYLAMERFQYALEQKEGDELSSTLEATILASGPAEAEEVKEERTFVEAVSASYTKHGRSL